jgi:hypothetical protein
MPTETTNRSGGIPQAVNMPSEIISQIQPFNEYRFDDCIAYLSAKHNRTLSTYEMMKLHVMIDVYHTLGRGKPVIGGSLYPFTNGPVSRSAKGRVTQWKKEYDQAGTMPDRFVLIEDRDTLRFKTSLAPDKDEFSNAELGAMDRAWDTVIGTLNHGGWEASQKYFHRDGFIGRAWQKARRRGGNLDWSEIIEEYAAETPETDLSHLRELLSC